MSITITSTKNNHTPTTKDVECNCLDYSEDGKTPEMDCPFCDGTGIEQVSNRIQMNMSNGNAITILNMVVPKKVAQDRYYGEISNKEIPDAIRRIMFLLNTNKDVQANIRKDDFETDKRMLSFGIDEEYIRDRLTTFLEILKYAQKHNENVYWS